MGFYSGIAYYIGIPLVFGILAWEIRNEKTYLRFVKENQIEDEQSRYGYDEEGVRRFDKKYMMDYISSLRRLRRLQVYIIISMLILLPIWNLAGVEEIDNNIHTEVVGPMGFYNSPADPVMYQVGPTFEVEYVKEKIKEEAKTYRPDLIDDVVDIDKLTRLPGQLAVYRLRGNRIVITYAYASPYPVMKAYAFNIIESQKGVSPIYQETSKTIIYPMQPNIEISRV